MIYLDDDRRAKARHEEHLQALEHERLVRQVKPGHRGGWLQALLKGLASLWSLEARRLAVTIAAEREGSGRVAGR
jgi:hypothetical protein